MTTNSQRPLWGRIISLGTILVLTFSICSAQSSMLGIKSNREVCCVKSLLNNLKVSLNETFAEKDAYVMSNWGLDGNHSNELDMACKIAIFDVLGNNNDTNMWMSDICEWLYYPATPEISQCREDLFYYCFKTSTTTRKLRIFNSKFGSYFDCN